MQSLTLTTRDERNDILNCWHPVAEATGALLNILRFSVARDDDEKEEDPDNYWHP